MEAQPLKIHLRQNHTLESLCKISCAGIFFAALNREGRNLSSSSIQETHEGTYRISQKKLKSVRCFDKSRFLQTWVSDGFLPVVRQQVARAEKQVARAEKYKAPVSRQMPCILKYLPSIFRFFQFSDGFSCPIFPTALLYFRKNPSKKFLLLRKHLITSHLQNLKKRTFLRT